MSLSTNLDFLSGALAATSKVNIVSQYHPNPDGFERRTFDMDAVHSHSLTWIGNTDIELVEARKGNGQEKCTLYVKTLTGKTLEIRKSANEFRI